MEREVHTWRGERWNKWDQNDCAVWFASLVADLMECDEVPVQVLVQGDNPVQVSDQVLGSETDQVQVSDQALHDQVQVSVRGLHETDHVQVSDQGLCEYSVQIRVLDQELHECLVPLD